MWVPTDSTDEQSLDQWVKWKAVYVRVGMCSDIKLTERLVGKIEGATSETTAHSNSFD